MTIRTREIHRADLLRNLCNDVLLQLLLDGLAIWKLEIHFSPDIIADKNLCRQRELGNKQSSDGGSVADVVWMAVYQEKREGARRGLDS